jgi:hypothetical protein
MATPEIYADFQNLDDDNRLKLTCAGTLQDLERQGIHLSEGLVLTLYTDDADDEGRPDQLRAEGHVQYNKTEQCWVAEIDWANLRHASEENACQSNGAGSPRATPTPEGRSALGGR